MGNSFLRLRPGMLCIFNQDTPSNSRHYHNCYELCSVTEGIGYFWREEERFEAKKGDVFIADPDAVHEIAIAEDKEGIRDISARSCS